MNKAKENAVKAEQRSLDELLARYWEGETTPKEELLLHLALLDQPKDSPYRKDLEVIEEMMAVAEQVKRKPILLRLRRPIAIAASVTALLVGGGYAVSALHKAGQSTLNGEPLYQAEVDAQAERAYRMLYDCLQESQSQCNSVYAQLDETDDLINESLNKLTTYTTAMYADEDNE